MTDRYERLSAAEKLIYQQGCDNLLDLILLAKEFRQGGHAVLKLAIDNTHLVRNQRVTLE